MLRSFRSRLCEQRNWPVSANSFGKLFYFLLQIVRLFGNSLTHADGPLGFFLLSLLRSVLIEVKLDFAHVKEQQQIVQLNSAKVFSKPIPENCWRENAGEKGKDIQGHSFLSYFRVITYRVCVWVNFDREDRSRGQSL